MEVKREGGGGDREGPEGLGSSNTKDTDCSVASTTREYRHGVPARVVIVTVTPHLMTYLLMGDEDWALVDWLDKGI